MEKRQSIIQKFSSFICLRKNNQQIQFAWKVDLMLEREMLLRQELDPDGKEYFWFQYFLRILLGFSPNQGIVPGYLHREANIAGARGHLSAYLQEACWKSAQDIHNEFQYIKHKYSLEDYFQIANLAASMPERIFKNFRFERSRINIEAYAISVFKRFIRNYLYHQDLEARRTKFSQYGLLKNLSTKELNEALLAQSISSQQVVHYILVWQCFNEVFAPVAAGSNRYTSPSMDDFIAIARHYEQRCEQLSLQPLTNLNKTIEGLLKDCIYAAKNYRSKQYLCFDEQYENIADARVSTWDSLEKQEEWGELGKVIENIFANLPQRCQLMFQLRLGLKLTQSEIANLIQFKYPELQKQYQVARQFKRYTRDIFKEFVTQWNQHNSEVLIDENEDIEKIQLALEECLERCCRKTFFVIFDEISTRCIHNNYISSSSNIATVQSLNSVSITLQLLELFQQEIELKLDLSPRSLSMVSDKITALANEWINVRNLG